MLYFHGFALKGEEIFFKEELIESDFCVAGFSYGAQKAFEYVYKSTERIDRLILLSPAFFQNHKKSFIRTQLRYYKADEKAYTEQFLKNVAYPSTINLYDYLNTGTVEALEALLSYVWDLEKILELIDRGVTIEVFMGEKDKIVDAKKSLEFFSKLTTVYMFKELGHLLK
ncbi:pimelyl-ACP methyl ester esterase BioV [bacterium]|nr:pimelyl-ACP methyl ester esterase BioV [bacterium]MBU1957212.1 pimelyl-ACP methyl ester esterase BioV [bacterium]